MGREEVIVLLTKAPVSEQAPLVKEGTGLRNTPYDIFASQSDIFVTADTAHACCSDRDMHHSLKFLSHQTKETN